MITPEIKRKILQVVNVFETGKLEGRYDALVVMNDGPGGIPQITFGRSQTTEYSGLRDLILRYIKREGVYAAQLSEYEPRIGKTPLTNDQVFKQLLIQAGRNDPLMISVQDEFFDQTYYQPAFKFFTTNGFELPLSLLVIYDSYIHSGRVPDFLRRRFGEKIPARGGNEKEWVTRYCDVRHQWLKYHSNPILRKTIYRTACFKEQIALGNWMLVLPIRVQGLVAV
ncbi:MAG TPA: chitosanase [Bacteroidales bacterium]|jgi:chitosanase|nr:chitosanase [Bacteroidales bacterium]MDI9573834.1 chitosanase [Bacteroidota bacterium]OQC61750.1 MAG: Chitosanase precursor [Bacteroidetes bacterium ADurb.Bin012]MBP9511816.1 chitosanase [Bacteroidales bacterium]MBP9589145.1 chitosanase [Bacteroidales bacterium]